MGSISTIVKNGDRMMIQATVKEEGIELTFADGCKGLIPYAAIPEIEDSTSLASIELPNPYEVVLFNQEEETVEIPWDFARHYCDPAYRPRVEEVATKGKQTFGTRVRQLRESAGLTQERLAEAAGISRVTLVRIENGEQSPRYENIMALARALGLPPEKLLVSPL